jgi:hypothetical protein
MEQGPTSNEMIEQNNGTEWTATMTDYAGGNAIERSLHPRALQRWCAKEKREFFFLLYRVFLLLFTSFSFSTVATRVIHYMTTSSKTHMNAHLRC